MTNSYLKSPESLNGELRDDRWSGPRSDVLIEVKRSNNARDIRDLLLGLVYALERASGTQARCLLASSRFTRARLPEEQNLSRRFPFGLRYRTPE
jgi:hypothetical protein